MNLHYNSSLIGNEVNLKENYDRAQRFFCELKRDSEDYTGWVNQPMKLSDADFDEIEKAAEYIRRKCDRLIVIGIGGSFLGTAAVLNALRCSAEGCPELMFAGNNLSGSYHAKFIDVVKDYDVCLCVVSKSGGTMESRLAFSILKDMMNEKYGREETASRIVAITDPVKGILRQEAVEEGYITFDIPGNIGGRYSAFTAGIMFPLAVAGVDIRAFVKGAAEIAADETFWLGTDCGAADLATDETLSMGGRSTSCGLDYALSRFALMEAGKSIEVFEYYDPALRLVGEWCKQLFGESEGKAGKGLFPAALAFSADLHSMGQFLQEGSQIFFETVINVLNEEEDVRVPESAGEGLAGRSLNEINQTAIRGVMAAHRSADIPILQIEIDRADEYCLGQLLYFLMMTAAVTGKLMGIDPFNQPGVEAYKAEIRQLLGQ